MLREFKIGLDARSLSQTDVFIDGEKIGEAVRVPSARMPKVWFAAREISGFELVVDHDLGAHKTADDAAFALIRRTLDERTRDSIIAKLAENA